MFITQAQFSTIQWNINESRLFLQFSMSYGEAIIQNLGRNMPKYHTWGLLVKT